MSDAPTSSAPEVTPATEAPAAPAAEATLATTTQAETPAQDKPLELKIPDGSKLEQADLDGILALAKEKGLNQEQAQLVLDNKHAAIQSFEEKTQQALSTLNDKTWKEELIADKEVGGKDFETNGILAHKAAETFFGKEFADELKTMKLNHHPKLFRGLVKIAKAMKDDTYVHPGATGGTKPIEEVFYGKAE